ncbi:MAG: YitT family protein [Bacillota bacterium]|nr:YitT family protein [Bacillota bacterium]
MSKIKSYLIILLGVVITAFAVSVFYIPNKIVTGGVSGLSTILYHKFGISAGLSFALINFILLVIGLKFLGRKFVYKTLICVGLLSILVELFTYIPPITDDIFLSAVFGSILYGFGIGLALSQGSSTGGSDIIGRLAQYKFPHIQIGKLLLAVDAIVILLSLIAFKTINLALYGILALIISSFSVDWLISKLNISRLAFVITQNGMEISKYLVSTSPRGVTIFNVTGAYKMENKTMLMCALKESEMPEFQKKILMFDKDAFIIYSESQQIIGNGFYLYK